MSADVGRDYLNRANTSLGEAKGASERFDWSLCVLRSAECVEFSLKAILKFVGIEYDRTHDVSGYLPGACDRFPEWFRAKVSRISLASRVLTILSLPAKYGDELLDVSPRVIFERPEAQAYLQIAEQIYFDCNRLFYEIKSHSS